MDRQSHGRIDTGSQRDRNLGHEVRDRLEDMIFGGELPLGGRLIESQLSEQLGVSRGPIREAVRLLQHDGLVVTAAHQGAFVRQLSIEEAVELYDLRATIAGYLCQCLTRRAGAVEFGELRGLIALMDACMNTGDEKRYFALNLTFHDRIAELSGAKRACELYASLGKEVRLLRRRVLNGAEAMRLSNAEHTNILAALEAGDGAAAHAAAELHHLNGKRRWLETLKPGG